MAENDSNLIRPVNVLHGITGSKPVKQRKEKKRRQHPDKEKTQQQSEGAIEQQNRNREDCEKQNDPNSIDYCA